MKKVLIGKYVNTHGIKGEIRIKSNFQYKDRVFKVGYTLIINDKEYVITSYRPHKDYDMVTFKGYNDINLVLPFKGSLVYIDSNLLNLESDEYLDSDLINISVFMNNKLIGKITSIDYITNTKKLLNLNGKLIPFELIKNIDLKNDKIEVVEVDGLI